LATPLLLVDQIRLDPSPTFMTALIGVLLRAINDLASNFPLDMDHIDQ
jgi:hypothetical protein